MNEFRQALDGYLAGQSDLESVERALRLSLARQPQLAAAHGAYIEALYRGNRIAGGIYLALVEVVRTAQRSQGPMPPAGGARPGSDPPASGPASSPAPPRGEDGGAETGSPSAEDGDRTRFRPPVGGTAPGAQSASGDDKTIFRGPAGPAAAARVDAADERTRFRAPGAHAPASSAPAERVDETQLRPRPVPPTMPATSGAAAPSAAAVPAGADASWSPATGSTTGASLTGGTTGASRATGASTWSDPNHWSGGQTVPLVVGSVLKERFILEEELGRGGMGIVFKARDLRMEEAQDRNPYVAVKILNEEFKRHPESLKALQREFRKAQSLAHPNVVTVGDFDRDGGNVFMTMELLEGEALDRLVKRVRGEGIESKQALRITRDICRAMAYAHERGVVHSDFKPANAFLTRDGTVKVFDFGIARATRRADKAAGTVTLFDASTLGALTPAYASCEMIEGLEPDARDDVYAIACVAYELLTGNHPFDRKSAVQARDGKLAPARPRSLSRAQWRALQRGLAFARESRSASAIELLNGLLPPKRSPTVYVGSGAAVLAVVVVAAVVVPGQIDKYRQQHWLAALRSGTPARVESVLPVLDTMDPGRRDTILADRDARDGLIHYYQGVIHGAESRGNYLVADQSAKKLLAYLPDYADAQRISDQVTSDTNDAINRESDRFDRDLAAGRLIPSQGADNIEAVLAAVRRIDPRHPLLHDPRLPGAYAAQTRLALQRSDTALAQQLVASGLKLAAQDPSLLDLRDQVQAAVRAQERAARVASLERSLSALLAMRPALADLGSRRADMMQLSTDAPQSDVLARVRQYAQGEIERQIQALEQKRSFDDAQSLLERFADLAAPAFVESQREQLSNERLAYEHKVADEAQLKAQRIADLKGRIKALLQRGPQDDALGWDAQLRDEEGRLTAYIPASDPFFAQARAATADAYLRKADQLRDAQRLAEAGQMLDRARAYAAQPAQLAREEQMLAAARSQQAAAAQAREKIAQIQALEQKLLDQAHANSVNDALASLAQLKGALAANDTFLTKRAPEAIGGGYLRLATNAAIDGRFDDALHLADKGLQVAPALASLEAARQRFERYARLESAMASVDAASESRVRTEIDQVERLAPDEAGSLEEALAHKLATRIQAMPDDASAERLKAVARRLFPHDALIARMFPAAKTAAASRAPARVAAPPPRPSVAAPTPAPAPAAPPRVARVTQAPKPVPLPAPVPASRPKSIHDCANPELVGAGANPRASCWDPIGAGRGPVLVVVPAPPNGHSFAIGRYEVSNADFARYCRATGQCKPSTAAPDLPVTSISVRQAQGYLAWLSRQSGATYRLPTAAEWTYAADAGTPGGQHLDANCEKSGIAATLLPIRSGEHNKWGLYNYDGNVQEWVRQGGELEARGGAYTDSFSQCTPETSRPHSGAPDAITGFRVLRELK